MKSDYIFKIRVHAYWNRCTLNCDQGCCNNSSLALCNAGRHLRCNYEFFFCPRPLGTPTPGVTMLESSLNERSLEDRGRTLQCGLPPLRSDVSYDGRPIDFTGTTFLGLSNPVKFIVESAPQEVRYTLETLLLKLPGKAIVHFSFRPLPKTTTTNFLLLVTL